MKTKEEFLTECIEKNNLDAFNASGTSEAVLEAMEQYAEQKIKSIKLCRAKNMMCGHLYNDDHCNRIGFCEFKLSLKL